ncbi:hypothetical protein I302_106208 [Kwoniella bestiolae CBS 10118]|uniref:Monooxygenase n=1 Tax=Kwoniella bestiolae CBS 10118 TaxID=1296100 RepID=A0A1B9G3B7_9TREE|nr:hypothetical protein I302_05333 [Kwoniella bestiolae CBS 10118]OCF25513.1 hypothetical protein I302_05333 [Kwoniella bestiolae CBS 10118]
MHVAIIGAGYSGLAAATAFLSFGHSVVIFDSSPDVGGVWSSTNHYPGLKAQNTGDTYRFSTLPMPREYPLHPDCCQIQAYMEFYAQKHHLDKEGRLRLKTRVILAKKTDDGWMIQAHSADHGDQWFTFDYLICAAGVFSQPKIPTFQGTERFTAAGSVIVHTSNVHRLNDFGEKHIVVIGYGKSACDVAVSASSISKAVIIVARDVTWKLPTYIGGVVHYSFFILTRFGESLFLYIRPWFSQRFLNHGIGKRIRAIIFGVMSWVIMIQLRLVNLGLLPNQPFETIAGSGLSLATPGFVEAAQQGKIKMERGVTVESLGERVVSLSNGHVLPADVIVCGTGWKQDIPSFLPEEYRNEIINKAGDWILYKHILPTDAPDLAFIGYNSSIFCPLTAEISSIWLAAHLELLPDLVRSLPDKESQPKDAEEEVGWFRRRTNGHHASVMASGTSVVPFSLSNIDERTQDLDCEIGWLDWLK